VVIALAVVASYNRFVSQRNAVQNAWSDIDTELKRRYDLIPNLVSTVQGYAAHERGVFEEVAQARSAGMNAQGPAAAAAAEGPFQMALGHLFAVAEAYPERKANQNFLQLQATLSDTEDRIQASRQIYNANVQQFNTRVQAFPSNIIANLFHFQPAEFFQIEGVSSVGNGARPKKQEALENRVVQTVEQGGSERESLCRNHGAFDTDAHSTRRGRLPGVRRSARHPGRGVQGRERRDPTDIAGIGGWKFLAVDPVFADRLRAGNRRQFAGAQGLVQRLREGDFLGIPLRRADALALAAADGEDRQFLAPVYRHGPGFDRQHAPHAEQAQ
jgi:LemA protein